MKVLWGFKKIKNLRGSCLSIGIFDGLHLGHRRIIRALVKKAREESLKSILISFHPHPQGEKLIFDLEERVEAIEALGIDYLILVRFNREFSLISPHKFLDEYLVKRLKVKYLYVGENFQFGKNKTGNVKLLKIFSKKFGFKLRVFRLLKKDSYLISSTNLRKFVQRADLKRVSKLLGRPLEFKGKVIKGEGVARTLGFPTANLVYPKDRVFLPAGVYKARIYFLDKSFLGLVYIGTRPTF
ncbi:MAG: riboflavin biosynthesis protein RibF, partial [Candidatus Omnitrophica bacterium]|nr:riboflavin biosynthesis protein RibF [Candidatus Omnitrophota bacterium]